MSSLVKFAAASGMLQNADYMPKKALQKQVNRFDQLLGKFFTKGSKAKARKVGKIGDKLEKKLLKFDNKFEKKHGKGAKDRYMDFYDSSKHRHIGNLINQYNHPAFRAAEIIEKRGQNKAAGKMYRNLLREQGY
jgi:hypothetical protein